MGHFQSKTLLCLYGIGTGKKSEWSGAGAIRPPCARQSQAFDFQMHLRFVVSSVLCVRDQGGKEGKAAGMEDGCGTGGVFLDGDAIPEISLRRYESSWRFDHVDGVGGNAPSAPTHL